ncbi:MAG: hypothetical protein WD468_08950 [Pirellulales bacterium]
MSIAPSARAALSITSIGTPFTINFDTTVVDVNNGQYAGTGFQPSPSAGQLDSDSWAVFRNGGDDPPSASPNANTGSLGFGGTQQGAGPPAVQPEWTRGTSAGGVTNGGIYSFDVSNGGTVDRALGVQPSGGMTFDGGSNLNNNGKITLKVTNNTGFTVANWSVTFDVYVLNNENRSSTAAFEYSPNSSDTNGAGSSSAYTAAGVNVVSPTTASGSPTWVKNSQTVTFTQSIVNGASLNIRWRFFDSGGSGSRDEMGIDNIRIAIVPEPSALLFGMLVCGVIGLAAGWRRMVGRRISRS